MLYQPTATDWRDLVPARKRHRFAPDALIVSGGDPAERCAYLVLEGTVRLSLLTPDGRERVLVYLTPGSLFGEQAALGRTSLWADLVAIADEPSEVGEVRAADIETALARRPDPFRDLMRITSEKTSLFLRAAARSTFGTPRMRVGDVLAALARRNHQLAVTQERLARLCGTTRVTVAAELHRLAAEGTIAIKRSKIVVHDIKRLAAANP